MNFRIFEFFIQVLIKKSLIFNITFEDCGPVPKPNPLNEWSTPFS